MNGVDLGEPSMGGSGDSIVAGGWGTPLTTRPKLNICMVRADIQLCTMTSLPLYLAGKLLYSNSINKLVYTA